MEPESTKVISISVEPLYDSKNSYPLDNRHVFQYNIMIENNMDFPVKLLSRNWIIYDLGFGFTEVQGEGVIGLTPEIAPGNSFDYFSNVMLRSGIGYMHGTYTFLNLETNETFQIPIPKFSLYSMVLSS